MTVTSITTVERRKLQGYDFYREILGSPKYVGAPMVDQSELVGWLSMQSYHYVSDVFRRGESSQDDTELR